MRDYTKFYNFCSGFSFWFFTFTVIAKIDAKIFLQPRLDVHTRQKAIIQFFFIRRFFLKGVLNWRKTQTKQIGGSLVT